jgi:hypothetical protein
LAALPPLPPRLRLRYDPTNTEGTPGCELRIYLMGGGYDPGLPTRSEGLLTYRSDGTYARSFPVEDPYRAHFVERVGRWVLYLVG